MLDKIKLIDLCLNSEFPGTDKWPAAHPIWDCWLPGHKSPKEAWKDKKLLERAVNNLIWMYERSKNKYPKFVEKINDAVNDDSKILKCILDRFTIAKIAPKITALSPAMFYRCIESQYDLSNGVYCPMAGFGGIVEGCRRWYEKHNIDMCGKIEAYDINENFCQWYGWCRRDALAQKIKTEKTVIACPPFGKSFEHWKGTPDEMSDINFERWIELIKEYVEAPDYIFFGPEKSMNKNGLFCKTYGVHIIS